ncbi:hypothetical protein ACIRD6_34140 [Streptomyces sp. NPDC102473]|uniref:hypothetical protein n=1 Tax=Streptomyces sp. NPDC102473 TaxID=3366180 RepID=UPI0037FB3B41
MSKQAAVQAAANAVSVATTAINNYGQTSPEAVGALQAACDSVIAAREQGATDVDFLSARPQ